MRSVHSNTRDDEIEIKVVGEAGVQEVIIDAQTGDIIAVEHDADDDEHDEEAELDDDDDEGETGR